MDGLRRLLFVCRRRLFTSSFGRQPELQFISNEETGLPSRLLPLATQMLIRTVEKEVESDFRLLSSPASSLETWFVFSFFSLSLSTGTNECCWTGNEWIRLETNANVEIERKITEIETRRSVDPVICPGIISTNRDNYPETLSAYRC